jgi:uncharacterized protein (TIGR02145 family)
MREKYVLSGKLGSILLVGFVGLISVIVVTIFYAKSTFWIHEGIVRGESDYICFYFIDVFVFILIIAIHVITVRYIAKCRSSVALRIYEVIVLLVIAYIRWFAFLSLVLNVRDFTDILREVMAPSALLVRLNNCVDCTYMFDLFVGAVLIIFFAFTYTKTKIDHNDFLFCENCEKEMERSKFDLKLQTFGARQVQSIVNSNILEILDLPRMENWDEGDCVRVSLFKCSSCENNQLVRFDIVKIVKGKERTPSEKHKWGDFIITDDEFKMFISKSEEESIVDKVNGISIEERVTIGSQVWMTNNLDTTHFRNGDLIPSALSAEEWKRAGEMRQPAWCYPDAFLRDAGGAGKIYNGYAVSDRRGLAPTGWHIPSVEELKHLAHEIQNKQPEIIGSVKDQPWCFESDRAWRFKDGRFSLGHLVAARTEKGDYFPPLMLQLWSSTEKVKGGNWYLMLDSDGICKDSMDNPFIEPENCAFGMSVRCVLD